MNCEPICDWAAAASAANFGNEKMPRLHNAKRGICGVGLTEIRQPTSVILGKDKVPGSGR